MYVLLKLKNEKSFAQGIRIYNKIGASQFIDNRIYKYGTHLFNIEPEEIVYEQPIDNLNFEWIELKQERKPSFIEKVKYKIFGIQYEKYAYNRPNPNEIVAVNYGCDLIEIAEYKGNRHWTTELCSYLSAKEWARLPKECLWV